MPSKAPTPARKYAWLATPHRAKRALQAKEQHTAPRRCRTRLGPSLHTMLPPPAGAAKAHRPVLRPEQAPASPIASCRWPVAQRRRARYPFAVGLQRSHTEMRRQVRRHIRLSLRQRRPPDHPRRSMRPHQGQHRHPRGFALAAALRTSASVMKKTKIGDVEFNTLASATSICCWPHARIDQDRMLLNQAWMNNMCPVRPSLGNLSPTIRMTISRKNGGNSDTRCRQCHGR